MTRLAEIRHSARMSLVELAAAAHVPYATLSMIECGKRKFSGIAVGTALKIADALGVDVTELLEDGWDK